MLKDIHWLQPCQRPPSSYCLSAKFPLSCCGFFQRPGSRNLISCAHSLVVSLPERPNNAGLLSHHFHTSVVLLEFYTKGMAVVGEEGAPTTAQAATKGDRRHQIKDQENEEGWPRRKATHGRPMAYKTLG